MVFRIDEFKNVCSVLSSVVDYSNTTMYNDMLELQVVENNLVMNVTNKEYFVSISTPAGDDCDSNFHATVNANLFLKLMSKITTDVVEFKIEGTNLLIKGNGLYKIPMIFDGESLLVLPEIHIDNVTINFDVDGNLLYNIYKVNSKQMSSGIITKPVQKLYYVDEQGAITFTSGACVNKFTLSTPVKMLLNSKLVKMFSLFKGRKVKFSMGYDQISDEMIATKVEFESDGIKVDSIISMDDSLVSSVPVSAIRDRAFKSYNYSVVINRLELLSAIDRLMLFPNSNTSYKMYSNFIFKEDHLCVFDPNGSNSEEIYYSDSIDSNGGYSCVLDMDDVKSILDCFSSNYVTVSFGDNQAIVISGENVYNIIPEVNMDNV